MKKWEVVANVRAAKYLGEVEAETEEEAKEKAMKLDTCYVSACHQCSKHFEDPEIDEIFVSEINE